MAYSVSYVAQNAPLGYQGISETSTTLRHPLGMRLRATDATYGEGEFVYMTGVASTAIGSVALLYPDAGTTTLATANDIGPIGVAMSANVASQYGWYQIYGKGVAKVLASFADNAKCYLTATAGSVDDAIVAGDRITNMRGASAIDTPATGLAEVELAFPFVDDTA